MEKKLADNQERILFMESMLEKSEKRNGKMGIWLKILFVCLMAMMIFIIVVLTVDVADPNIGYQVLR
jgi:uncharacterized protein YpmS